jgi:hypothetical protein
VFLDDESTMARKRILPPDLPETGIERLQELKSFISLLAEFYDYGHKDVYESVFHTRIAEILNNVDFEDKETEQMGMDILESNTTCVRTLIQFFKRILLLAEQEVSTC